MGLDLDACISQLLQKQLLAESLLKEICEKTKELLMNESNCVSISAPVTVESIFLYINFNLFFFKKREIN